MCSLNVANCKLKVFVEDILLRDFIHSRSINKSFNSYLFKYYWFIDLLVAWLLDWLLNVKLAEFYPLRINVREYRRGNLKWTIQRNWQHHWVHSTKKNKRKTQHNMCWTLLCAQLTSSQTMKVKVGPEIGLWPNV